MIYTKNIIALVLCLYFLSSTTVTATVINVPPGQSIQAVIDTSNDGDQILLDKGVYEGDIDYKGKAISIIGQGKNSVIKGSGYRSVVRFISGEKGDSVLDQVRVTGGLRGGGILTDRTSPTIRRCWIIENRALGSGSAVTIFGNDNEGNSARLFNNIIAFNKTRVVTVNGIKSNKSSAIYILNASPKLVSNTLVRNDFSAIKIVGDSSPYLLNNIIAFNKRRVHRVIRPGLTLRGFVIQQAIFLNRTRGMAVSFSDLSSRAYPELDHNLFFNNSKGDVMINDEVFESFNEFAATSVLSNNINIGTNISELNPKFVDLHKLNLALQEGSVAKAAGASTSDFNEDSDLTNLDIGATGGPFPIGD